MPQCDKCSPCNINGAFCHETGCPNGRKGYKWNEHREQWIRYFECFYCGYDVESGESCDCQNPDY